jgi:hypothetical protein
MFKGMNDAVDSNLSYKVLFFAPGLFDSLFTLRNSYARDNYLTNPDEMQDLISILRMGDSLLRYLFQ